MAKGERCGKPRRATQRRKWPSASTTPAEKCVLEVELHDFSFPLSAWDARCPAVPPGDITHLLQRIEQGDAHAAGQLMPLVYGELRRIAAARMAGESPGHTLQPTALVHEAWLALGGDDQPRWRDRAHFFGAAAEAMRHILIDRARSKQAVRHGGGLEKVHVDAPGLEIASPIEDDAELLLVNEALAALAAHDSRMAELVKLKFFAGLTLEDAAELLGISPRTAARDWAYARAWLFREVKRLRG